MRGKRSAICGSLVALAFLSGSLLHVAAAADDPDVSQATIWCLDPANSGHVAAAAATIGTVKQRNQNVVLEGEPLSIRQWQKVAEDDFEVACGKAFALYQPEADDDSGSDEEDGIGTWAIPLLSALAGAGAGAAGSHLASVLRDRKLWIREDAAAVRRLSGELRSRVDLLAGFNPESEEGLQGIAGVRNVIADLQSILDEEELIGDTAAEETCEELQALLTELEASDPQLGSIKQKGISVSKKARENAATWARMINPKPRIRPSQ